MIKNILVCIILAATVQAVDFEAGVYDLEDEFKNIPDNIGIEEVRFNFKLTNWLFQGFERGLYNDSTIMIDEDCFGEYYVKKINELEYI